MLDSRAAALLCVTLPSHCAKTAMLTCAWLDCCADCPAGLETPDPCRDPKEPVPEIVQTVFGASKPSMCQVCHPAKTKTVAGWLNDVADAQMQLR